MNFKNNQIAILKKQLMLKDRTIAKLTEKLAQFSIHAMDKCRSCKTGRIVVFAKSKYCLACQIRAQEKTNLKK